MEPIARVPGLYEELCALYDYYCWYGDRVNTQNIGATGKGLRRRQFHQMLRDSGLVDSAAGGFIQPALVDCVLESRIGKGAPYLSFAAFVESVCAVSARFDGNRSWRANTYIVLARFLLPMASARASAKARKAWAGLQEEEPASASVRNPRKGGQPVDYSISDEITYWVDRVTQIKAVEEAMLTYEIQKIFEVPHERLGEVLRGTALEATMPPGGAGGGGGGGGGMEDFMGGSDVSSAAADGAASMHEPDE